MYLKLRKTPLNSALAVLLLAIILIYFIWVRIYYGEVLFDIINISLTSFIAISAFSINFAAYKSSERVKINELLEELISTTKDIQTNLSTSQKRKINRRKRSRD